MRMVLAVFCMTLLVGAADATIPDPDLCSADPLDALGGMLLCPNSPSAPAFSEFTVNVRNGDNEAIPDAFVEIVLGVPGNHCLCGTPMTGTTDEFGNVTFNIGGGGCTEAVDAVRIIANSVPIRSYEAVKSPDWDGSSDCAVVLSDFVTFGGAYSGGLPGCHDYDNSGVTDLGDFVVFGQGWGLVCE